MRIPQFLDIQFVDVDGQPIPTAMAWSLADGSLKAIVIEPADAWHTDEADTPGFDPLYQHEQGVPLLELVRDLNEDLSDQTVFVDGLDPDEELVERIFDSVAMPVPFELVVADQLLKHLSRGDLEDRRRELLFSHSLDPQLPESGVFALLMLAQEEGIIPDAPEPDDL